MKNPCSLNVWLFFGLVYALTAILYLPVLLSGKGMSTPSNTVLVVLITFVPSGMGILFTYLTRGSEGRRDFWQRVIRWPRSRTKLALVGIWSCRLMWLWLSCWLLRSTDSLFRLVMHLACSKTGKPCWVSCLSS